MRVNFTKVAAAAAILAGVSTGVHAIPYVELKITDFNVTTSGFVTKSCSTDTAANVAACAANGFVASGVGATDIAFGTTFGGIVPGSGLIGSYTIVSTTAESNSPGTTLQAFLNRSQTSAIRNSPGNADVHQLIVDFRAYDYALPNGPTKYLTASAALTANSGSYVSTDTVTSSFSVDVNNLGTGTDAYLSCALAQSHAGAALDESCSLGPQAFNDPNSPNSLFSMRSIQIFDMAIGSRLNTTANSAVVPEPFSTALVGVGLFGLALTSRRRAKKV